MHIKKHKNLYSMIKISLLVLSFVLVSNSLSFLRVNAPTESYIPTPSERPESQISPEITAGTTKEPTLEPTPTPAPTPTPQPTPTPKPTAVPTPRPTPSPIPTKAPDRYISGEAVLSDYGELTIAGMPKEKFESTLNFEMTNVNIEGEYEHQVLDLKVKHSYDDLISFMENLSKHEAVNLSIIGKSTQGRDIYHLELDFPSENQNEKKIVMLSGNVHAREMGTGLYILKQFSELLEKSETDEHVRYLLENVKFVSIPIVNPDGREIVYKNETSSWKANASGVDINRNFPSVNAGQRLWGVNLFYGFEKYPGPEGYAGPHLGSEAETRIMMRWFNNYVPFASYYIDYHQMGRLFFVGENWDLLAREKIKWADASRMNNLFNQNLASSRYREVFNGQYYGVNGKGSCTTDYSLSVALGMTFSEKYGRMSYKYNDQELLLVMFRDLNKYSTFKPVNDKFITFTLEIGLPDSLGYTEIARNSFATEYYKANHDKYLTLLMEMALE